MIEPGLYSRWRGHRGSRRASFALAAWMLMGCSSRKDEAPRRPDDPRDANDYLLRAVRESAEGIVILDYDRSVAASDPARMRQIAQDLRQPAASCFLARAIETMELESGKDGPALTGVPSGQAKIRVRLRPDGTVMHTEIMESAFEDEDMESCVRGVIEARRFPATESGVPARLDLVYWVSLGFYSGLNDAALQQSIRRNIVENAVVGKGCVVQAQLRPGTYEIQSLNLVNQNGETMINRVRGDLPEPTLNCLRRPFRRMGLPPEKDSFARPVFGEARFIVDAQGGVTVEDEQWARLLRMEEEAAVEARRVELQNGVSAPPSMDFQEVSEPKVEDAVFVEQDAATESVTSPESTISTASDTGNNPSEATQKTVPGLLNIRPDPQR